MWLVNGSLISSSYCSTVSRAWSFLKVKVGEMMMISMMMVLPAMFQQLPPTGGAWRARQATSEQEGVTTACAAWARNDFRRRDVEGGQVCVRTRASVASTGGRENALGHTDTRSPFPPTFLLVRFSNVRRHHRPRDTYATFFLFRSSFWQLSVACDRAPSSGTWKVREYIEIAPLKVFGA